MAASATSGPTRALSKYQGPVLSVCQAKAAGPSTGWGSMWPWKLSKRKYSRSGPSTSAMPALLPPFQTPHSITQPGAVTEPASSRLVM